MQDFDEVTDLFYLQHHFAHIDFKGFFLHKLRLWNNWIEKLDTFLKKKRIHIDMQEEHSWATAQDLVFFCLCKALLVYLTWLYPFF